MASTVKAAAPAGAGPQREGSSRSRTVPTVTNPRAAATAAAGAHSHQPLESVVMVKARATPTELGSPPISQSGQRRRPGQAKGMHNKRATRMKPPTILVAVDATPTPTSTSPTDLKLTARERLAVSPERVKNGPSVVPTEGGRTGDAG